MNGEGRREDGQHCGGDADAWMRGSLARRWYHGAVCGCVTSQSDFGVALKVNKELLSSTACVRAVYYKQIRKSEENPREASSDCLLTSVPEPG